MRVIDSSDAGNAASQFSMSAGWRESHSCRVTTPDMDMFANQIQKNALVEFWAQFGGRTNAGIGYGKEAKINALKILAGLVPPYKNQKTATDRRAAFNESKQTLHKFWIRRNQNCFCCHSPASSRHHIIQLQNGGINSRKNVVSLCESCHAEIHPWLKQ